MARYWYRARRFLALKVLHTDDTPHAIALGTGIAMLVAFLPLIGIQTIVAVAIAALFRANKVVCIPVVWITNPATMLPIYGACLGLGRFVTSGTSPGDPTSWPQETVALSELQVQSHVGFLEYEFWSSLFSRVIGFGVELWIGCVILGLVFAVLSYFLSRWGVTAYRERRRRRILRRNLLRSKMQRSKVTRRAEAV